MSDFYIPNPSVVYKNNRGQEVSMDVWSRLLQDRIIYLGTPINDSVANMIIAQLLHLESEDPDKDISIYINSPGGEITGLFAIYDTMQFIKCDASAAAVLLAAGTKGKRFALPNARILIHQPLGGAQGQATEIEIQAKEILRIRAALDDLLSEKTGQTAEKIHADTDRDYIMSAEEAKEYGMIDAVMTSRDLSSAALVAASSN